MCRETEKQAGYCTVRTRNKRATLTALSSRNSRRRRVFSHTRKRRGHPAAAPPSTTRFVSLRSTPASDHPLYTPTIQRWGKWTPPLVAQPPVQRPRQPSRPLGWDSTIERPRDRPSRLRRNRPREKDGKSARFRIVKIVKISTFLYG